MQSQPAHQPRQAESLQHQGSAHYGQGGEDEDLAVGYVLRQDQGRCQGHHAAHPGHEQRRAPASPAPGPIADPRDQAREVNGGKYPDRAQDQYCQEHHRAGPPGAPDTERVSVRGIDDRPHLQPDQQETEFSSRNCTVAQLLRWLNRDAPPGMAGLRCR